MQKILKVKSQLTLLATVTVTIYITVYASLFLYGCLGDFPDVETWEEKVFFHLDVYTLMCFTVLAVTFSVVGILLIRALKTNFPKFYIQYRHILIIATVLLAVPLFFRAVFDGIKLCFPSFMNYVDSNYTRNALYNMIFFTLTTYLPILSQITSLVFGFLRHKQVKLQGRKGGEKAN